MLGPSLVAKVFEFVGELVSLAGFYLSVFLKVTGFLERVLMYVLFNMHLVAIFFFFFFHKFG